MKKCPKCQAQLVDNVKFCYECGCKLSDSVSAPQNTNDDFPPMFTGFNSSFDFDEPKNDTASDTSFGSFDFSSLEIDNDDEDDYTPPAQKSTFTPSYDDGVIDSGLVIKNGVLLQYKGKNKRVVIPSTVTKIADEAFYMNDYVEDVIVGTNVKEIGDDAFIEFKNLRMVSLPEGLKKIGRGAFAFNENLTIIDIPRSVTEIGENAFENTGVKSVVIPKGVETVSDEAFRICGNLQKVTISEGVKTIGTNAFELCESLTQINLPSTLRTIEHGAFARTGISTITLPEGLYEMEGYVFFECLNLREIKIPKSVKKIEGNAFVSCDNLKKIYVPRHLNFDYEDSEIDAQIIYY